MGKPTFCICENKGDYELRRNRKADHSLCFRYMVSTIPQDFKPLTIFCGCAAWFVFYLDGTKEHLFSQDTAQLLFSAFAVV